MKRLLFSLTLVGLLAAACAPLATPEPTRTSEAQTRPYPSLPTSTPGVGEGQTQPYPPPPTGAPSQGNQIPAVLAAIQSLASRLGLPTDQIKLISVEAVEWPDGCLGVSRPDVLCLQVITPGYLVVLEANGQQYEYHTNQDGSIVISTAEGALLSEPQTAAVSTLAHALNVKLADVKVISSTPLTIMAALTTILNVTRSTSRKKIAVRMSEKRGPVLLTGITTETLPRSSA